MIAPMRKYAFLVHHDDYRTFLQSLRDLGVAHIELAKHEPTPQCRLLMDKWQRYHQHHQYLSQREVEESQELDPPLAGTLVKDLEEQVELRFALDQAILNTRAQLRDLTPWENIPLGRLKQLRDHAVHTHFFRCSHKAYQPEWDRDYLVVHLGETGDNTDFAVITRSANAPQIDAHQQVIPDTSFKQVKDRLMDLESQMAQTEEKINKLASFKYVLQDAMDHISESIDWDQAVHQAESQADGRLITLKGWIPKAQQPAVEQFLEGQEVAWLSLPVTPEEDIPILLKNNRFARLFHPIGELFALPNHTELDLTAFFAPFYALFFGLCLGDVGYGALLLIGATVVKRLPFGKAKKDLFTLVQWLSLSTIIAGFVTGTFFGAEMSKMSSFQSVSPYFLGPNQLFSIAIWIGLLQIAMGMILRMANRFRQFGFVYSLSSLGWLLGLIGSVLWWNDALPPYQTWITLSGVGLILFFSEVKGNIFMRFGFGLWELYGASGLVGDMLSYIRLFALGLSSAILGLVVNDIAFSVLSGGSFFGWLFCIIILLVGHGMNFFLATLSAFVHPMRLTFVEFYKNAGFAGGGKPYKPFAKKLKPEL